jgi:hypothetical protein
MNNKIEITYITASNLPNIKSDIFLFCQKLNDFLTCIKLCHIFTNNYNTHKIYGDLYDDLSQNFDKFQEEIVGVSKSNLDTFVNSSILNSLQFFINCKENQNYLEDYKQIKCQFLGIFQTKDFQDFLKLSQPSGINNTLEEIYSSINKADYLLSMC